MLLAIAIATACIAESTKQLCRLRIVHHFPFGVPLHRHGKTTRRFDPYCFDLSIRRNRLSDQARAKAIYTLAMHRINLYLRCSTE